MRRWFLWMSLSVSACAEAQPNPVISLTPSVVVTVPNFDKHGPPCIVKIPASRAQCTDEGCYLPLPKKSTMPSLQLQFSCVPRSSRTEFDRPPPDAKVQAIRTPAAKGLFMLLNDFQSEPEDPKRLLTFCLWGRQNLFCGDAHVRRLSDGVKADGTATVKSFIEGVELQEPPRPDSSE